MPDGPRPPLSKSRCAPPPVAGELHSDSLAWQKSLLSAPVACRVALVLERLVFVSFFQVLKSVPSLIQRLPPFFSDLNQPAFLSYGRPFRDQELDSF